jgi:hypothetical protein
MNRQRCRAQLYKVKWNLQQHGEIADRNWSLPQESTGHRSGLRSLRPDLTCVFLRPPWPVTVTWDLQVWVTVCFFFSHPLLFFKITTCNRGTVTYSRTNNGKYIHIYHLLFKSLGIGTWQPLLVACPLLDMGKSDCILLPNHITHIISHVLVCDWRSLCLVTTLHKIFEKFCSLLHNRKFRHWLRAFLRRRSIWQCSHKLGVFLVSLGRPELWGICQWVWPVRKE